MHPKIIIKEVMKIIISASETKRKGIVPMRKTTIQLTDELYFYLKEKVLIPQKKNQGTSMVSFIRELIDQDMNHSRKGTSKTDTAQRS